VGYTLMPRRVTTHSFISFLIIIHNKYFAHNFFSPECHLSMTEAAMAIGTVRAVHEAVSMVSLTSNCSLKLVVGPYLGIKHFIKTGMWWNITLPCSLSCLF
jgi:hypothetical protein